MKDVNATGMGYAGENWSVDREIKSIEDKGVLQTNYFIFITDEKNKKDTKTMTIKHSSFCYDAAKILVLRNELLEKGFADMGFKKNPKKALCHLYIIEKKQPDLKLNQFLV